MKSSLKNKNAQTRKHSLGNILIISEGIPKLMEIDRGKEFYNSIFQNFLTSNNIKYCSRNRSLGAVFADRFNRTIRHLLKDRFLNKVMLIGLV